MLLPPYFFNRVALSYLCTCLMSLDNTRIQPGFLEYYTLIISFHNRIPFCIWNLKHGSQILWKKYVNSMKQSQEYNLDYSSYFLPTLSCHYYDLVYSIKAYQFRQHTFISLFHITGKVIGITLGFMSSI